MTGVMVATQAVEGRRFLDLAVDAFLPNVGEWKVRARLPVGVVEPIANALVAALEEMSRPQHRANGPAEPVFTQANHDHIGMYAPGCPWCQPRTYAETRARHRAEEIQ